MDGNVIVGQSGGPTSVINSSLAGVYKTAIDRGAKKFMVCSTVLRDFLMVSMLTFQRRLTLQWISIY